MCSGEAWHCREGESRLQKENLVIVVLTHPPYSPDLSPCDVFLFSSIKEELIEKLFRTEDEIIAAWSASVKNLNMDAI